MAKSDKLESKAEKKISEGKTIRAAILQTRALFARANGN